jgi:hypothetical protein
MRRRIRRCRFVDIDLRIGLRYFEQQRLKDRIFIADSFLGFLRLESFGAGAFAR